jgi:hypothetical protein
VTVEAGQRGHRPALDLDDRNSEAGGVQDELLEGLPTLGHDQQAACLASSDEGFFDRTAAGHDLVSGFDQSGFRRLEAGPVEGCGAGDVRTTAIERRTIRPVRERARGRRAVSIRAATLGAEGPPTGWPERPLERRPIRAASIGRSLAGLESGTIRNSPGALEPRSLGLVPDVGAILTLGTAPEAEAGPGRVWSLGSWSVESWSVEAWLIALRPAGPRAPARVLGTRPIVAGPVVAGMAEARAVGARAPAGTIEGRPIERRAIERGSIAGLAFVRAARDSLLGPEAGRARAAAARSRAAARA